MPQYTRNNRFLFSSVNATGTGASADSIVNIGVISFKKWRVIDCGFLVMAAGTSTIAELVQIGVRLSDIGSADLDYFGQWTQDITSGKNWAGGDMFTRVGTHTSPTKSTTNNGSHTFTAGTPDGLNVWQSTQAGITITKKNVSGSTGTVIGWVLIETQE